MAHVDKVHFGHLAKAMSDKGVLTSDMRNALPDSAFAAVYKDASGKKVRKFPIQNAGHVRNALARFGQEKGVPDAVMAAAKIKIHAAATKFGIK